MTPGRSDSFPYLAGFDIIDVHGHLFPADYVDRLVALGHTTADGVRRIGAGDTAEELSLRFELMDRVGINLQVVSPSSLVPWVGGPAEAADVARSGNDRFADLVSRHPARLAAFAVLPLPHVDASLEEVERALALPGIVGFAVTTSVAGRSIADATFEPLFEQLNRRGAVLFVHPAGVDAESALIREAGLSWLIGAPIEDTVAAVHLIARGIPARFPAMRIVIPHLGGALPMLLGRLDAQFPRLVPDAPELPSAAVRRLWFDTVRHGLDTALAAAVASFGADRLVLGTDYPYLRGEQVEVEVSSVRKAALDAPAIEGILGRTASDLLGIDP